MVKNSRQSGGSAAGGGFDFQNRIIAYIAAHMLCERELNWLRLGVPDVPTRVAAESGGPGDDVRIEIGERIIEIQAKRGLRAGSEFWGAITNLVEGLKESPDLIGILAVDERASKTIREEFRDDIDRLRRGCDDRLHQLAKELVSRISGLDVPNPAEIVRRLYVIKLDLQD